MHVLLHWLVWDICLSICKLLPWYKSYFTDGAASLFFHRRWPTSLIQILVLWLGCDICFPSVICWCFEPSQPHQVMSDSIRKLPPWYKSYFTDGAASLFFSSLNLPPWYKSLSFPLSSTLVILSVISLPFTSLSPLTWLLHSFFHP